MQCDPVPPPRLLLRSYRSLKFHPRWSIVKQIPHHNRCPRRAARFFVRLLLPARYDVPGPAISPCKQVSISTRIRPRWKASASSGIPACQSVPDPPAYGSCWCMTQKAVGTWLEGIPQPLSGHPQKRYPALLDLYRQSRGPGVNGIFHQLLDHRSRRSTTFPCRDKLRTCFSNTRISAMVFPPSLFRAGGFYPAQTARSYTRSGSTYSRPDPAAFAKPSARPVAGSVVCGKASGFGFSARPFGCVRTGCPCSSSRSTCLARSSTACAPRQLGHLDPKAVVGAAPDNPPQKCNIIPMLLDRNIIVFYAVQQIQ